MDTRSEKDLEEAATIALVDSEVNQEYNWHDFNLTEQRYEEYEALKGSKGILIIFIHIENIVTRPKQTVGNSLIIFRSKRGNF